MILTYLDFMWYVFKVMILIGVGVIGITLILFLLAFIINRLL